MKINKLGVSAGNVERTPEVANPRSAFLSWTGVNTGRGIGATVSRTGGGSTEDIQEGKAARAKEKTVPKAR